MRRTTSYFNHRTTPSLRGVECNWVSVATIDGRTDGSAAAISSGNSRCNLIMNYDEINNSWVTYVVVRPTICDS
jgi:hypothetical protein